MTKQLGNPFVLSGYVNRSFFCDREHELEWMKENWKNSRNMAIYSWRRLGKTALIRCFFDELQNESGVDTIYIDLMGTRTMGSAIKTITRSIHEKYGRSRGGISATFGKLFSSLGATIRFDPLSGTPELSFSWSTSDVPDRSLDALGGFLSTRKNSIIIAIDEFQQLTAYPDEGTEAQFRAWMQNFPNIDFIYSGSHRNMMRSIFSSDNRPFYRSVQLMELHPIALPSYIDFIKSQFNAGQKEITDEQIKHIYKWSRGQTYCIQLICNKLFGSCDIVDSKEIERVCTDIIEQEKPIFANYTQLLTDTQWKVLMAIAKEEPLENPYSKEFLRKYEIDASSSLNTALKSLIKKELVIREDQKYLVHDVLLSHWLRTL